MDVPKISVYESDRVVNVNISTIKNALRDISRIYGVPIRDYEFTLEHETYEGMRHIPHQGFIEGETKRIHLPKTTNLSVVLHEAAHYFMLSRDIPFEFGKGEGLYFHLIEETLVELTVADILTYRFPSMVDFIGDHRQIPSKVLKQRLKSKDPSERFVLRQRFLEDALLAENNDEFDRIKKESDDDISQLFSLGKEKHEIGLRKIVATIALSNSSQLYKRSIPARRLFYEITKDVLKLGVHDFYFLRLIPLVRGCRIQVS